MCNCISKCKEFVKDVLVRRLGIEERQIEDQSIDGESLLFGENTVETELATYLNLTYRPTKVNGEPTKNKKIERIGLKFSYCPFCGEPYKKQSTKTEVIEQVESLTTNK